MFCFICNNNVFPSYGNGQRCSDTLRRTSAKINEVLTDVIGPTCIVTIDDNDAVCNTCLILLEEFYKFKKKVTIVSQLLLRQVCRTYSIEDSFEQLEIDQRALCAFTKNKKNEYSCKHCMYKTKFLDTITPHFLFHNRDFDICNEDDVDDDGKEMEIDSKVPGDNEEAIDVETLRENKVIKKFDRSAVNLAVDVVHSTETEAKVESTIEDEMELIFQEDDISNDNVVHVKEELQNSENEYGEYEISSVWNDKEFKVEHKEVVEEDEEVIVKEMDENFEDNHNEIEYLIDEPLQFIMCKICDTTYSDETAAAEHMKDAHCYCFHCGKEYLNDKLIEKHFKNVHMDSPKLKCDICAKKYTNKPGLIKHLKRHFQTEKYQCPYCEKCYWEKANYTDHLSKHTMTSNYICQECGRTFTSQSTYRLHIRYHETPTPFNCKLCPKAYASASSLAIHRRKEHTGEISHKCEFCGKGFASKGLYNIHRIQHVHIYPYNCSKCNKGFVKKRDFSRHMIKYHDDYSYVAQKQREFKIAIRPKIDEESKVEEQ